MTKTMTRYEYLMNRKDEAEQKALEMTKKNEPELAQFYMNGAKGFEKKAKRLTIEEAGKNILVFLIK